ncbi:hypothetical protein [Segetibacter koreensis]|uniref:hypothetical protein n=1 Tax=Segetibacter koreensis TaxID=398037 RepID=UPI00038139EA|nr:hypothetical protein [Segetibacter koreensis]
MLAKKVFVNEQTDEKELLTEIVNGNYTAFTCLLGAAVFLLCNQILIPGPMLRLKEILFIS